MAQRPHVPKFGNWDGEENVPYTVYFDKARKDRTGGKMINPNDPQDNPGVFSADTTPVQDSNSPAHHDTIRGRAASHLPHRHGDHGVSPTDTPKRASRLSGGSERSIEHSPLHPHYQARISGKGSSGVSSPSWEKKGSSESSHGLAPSTPGRSRLKSTRGDETPDRSPAVPKFGDWDESNPASADGFSHIFNKVREERRSGSANVQVHVNNGRKQSHNTSSSSCCFPWCRK